MERRIKNFRLVDIDTGELSDALITPVKARVRGRWMRLFQDAAAAVSRSNLRGESLRVLWYLLSVSDFKNIVPATKPVAGALGMKQAGVARAYRELRERGLLLEKDGVFYLLPLLAWKGTDVQLEARCRELLPGLKPKLLQEVNHDRVKAGNIPVGQ